MDTGAWIARSLGVDVAGPPERVQELWSGYGAIERWRLAPSAAGGPRSVVLKRIRFPSAGSSHPRGWDSDRSDARKRRSYEVERAFYRTFAGAAEDRARLPALLAEHESAEGALLLLEDLDAAGFPARRSAVSDDDVGACVRWLASFHAAFLGRTPDGLWERGTYWHLATRPDELAAVEDPALKDAAARFDLAIGAARHQTLVHGDAKLANFCFPAPDERCAEVSAVDLQYVGGGVGVQDLAYFLGSCLDDRELTADADAWLDRYFTALDAELAERGVDGAPVEAEWRVLWPYAWADFHRFLAGWAPGHWKLSAFSERMTRSVL
ncbi:MAG: phosphotransferase [Planctomycetota bacterium]